MAGQRSLYFYRCVFPSYAQLYLKIFCKVSSAGRESTVAGLSGESSEGLDPDSSIVAQFPLCKVSSLGSEGVESKRLRKRGPIITEQRHSQCLPRPIPWPSEASQQRDTAFSWEKRGLSVPSCVSAHMCTGMRHTHTCTRVLCGQGGALVSRPPFLLGIPSSFGVKDGEIVKCTSFVV